MNRHRLLRQTVGAVLALGLCSAVYVANRRPATDPSPVDAPPPEQVTPEATAIPQQAMCVKVFSEICYQVEQEKWGKNKIHEFTQGATGTAFALRVGNDRYLITAKHVCIGKPVDGIARLGELDLRDSDFSIRSASSRIRVSHLAFKPTAMCISDASDVCVMTLPDEAWDSLDLREFSVPPGLPMIGKPTYAWGFPATTSPQMLQGPAVTEVRDEYFVLNSPLDPGFSGGPVLSDDHQLLGLAIRSTEKQSRVLRLRSESLNAWVSSLVPYADGFTFHGNP